MITIISGTNRKDSMTLKVAKLYYHLMKGKEKNVHLITLEGLNVWERNPQLLKLENEILIPSEKFVFIMPEYNGSFPGILKLLLDNTDIKKCWWHKKAALVGLADGRGGNLRGIEHMTNILHYLKMNVHYNKLPLSKINEEITDSGEFSQTATLQSINQQIDEFLKY
jgi:chromate reductase